MKDVDTLIASLAQEATPIKPAAHPFVLFAQWMGGATAYVAVTLLFSGLRPDLLTRLHSPLYLLELILLLSIIATASLSAALLVFPDMHQKRRMAFSPALMLALLAALVFVSWQADSPPSPPPEHSIECTLYIAFLSLLPAAWMFYSMRKFASTHHYLAGSIALLASFSMGALSLRLYEQTDSILHVMQWHYLPMIAVSLVGLWLGKTLLKW